MKLTYLKKKKKIKDLIIWYIFAKEWDIYKIWNTQNNCLKICLDMACVILSVMKAWICHGDAKISKLQIWKWTWICCGYNCSISCYLENFPKQLVFFFSSVSSLTKIKQMTNDKWHELIINLVLNNFDQRKFEIKADVS